MVSYCHRRHLYVVIVIYYHLYNDPNHTRRLRTSSVAISTSPMALVLPGTLVMYSTVLLLERKWNSRATIVSVEGKQEIWTLVLQQHVPLRTAKFMLVEASISCSLPKQSNLSLAAIFSDRGFGNNVTGKARCIMLYNALRYGLR